MATRSIGESPKRSKKRASSVVKSKPARKPSAEAPRPRLPHARERDGRCENQATGEVQGRGEVADERAENGPRWRRRGP